MICFFLISHLRTFFSLILEREGGREGGRERVRERHGLVACYLCPARMEPRDVPWPRIEPSTFCVQDDAPTNQAPLARTRMLCFWWLLLSLCTVSPCLLYYPYSEIILFHISIDTPAFFWLVFCDISFPTFLFICVVIFKVVYLCTTHRSF